MKAIYKSSSSFGVVGDRTIDFSEDRRLKIDCGPEGIQYASVLSSVFSTETIVTIKESFLTPNIRDVLYSVVKTGDDGNLPKQPSFDSIILKAPDNTEWIVRVNNLGVLYTEQI